MQSEEEGAWRSLSDVVGSVLATVGQDPSTGRHRLRRK